jgi:hypothetical protein
VTPLSTFFSQIGAWGWLIAAAVLFILEVVAPGMHMIWFAVAALAVGGLALLYPITWPLQIALFLAVAALSAIAARRVMKNDDTAQGQGNLNVRAAQYMGQTFEVAEAISGGRGRVKVGDTLWLAEGPDAPAGARVRVVGANGIVLVVQAA